MSASVTRAHVGHGSWRHIVKMLFPLLGRQWTIGSIVGPIWVMLLLLPMQIQAAVLAGGAPNFAPEAPAATITQENKAAYKLPPDKLAKAIRVSRDYTILG